MNDKTREFYEKFGDKKITQKCWDGWVVVYNEQPISLVVQGYFRCKDNDGRVGKYRIDDNWIIHPDTIPCPHCGRGYD